MPIRIDKTATGGWLSYMRHDGANIYAHAATSTNRDHPITVFWGGKVDTRGVIKFFRSSAGLAISPHPKQELFRTVVFTPDEERVFNDREKPLFAREVRKIGQVCSS